MSFKPRKHQKELQELLAEVTAGSRELSGAVLNVTAGGGKSASPVLTANALISANHADKICWVVPRSNLQSQAAEAFADPFLRGSLGHSLDIHESTNEADPSRGTAGYVTTYQALGRDSAGINAFEFNRHRYILVLDEIHHVAEGSLWHRALIPLQERAVFTLYMTGTMSRHNQQKIAFLSYKEVKAS